MPVSTDYVVRETGANLWRNRLMTIAAVLTVAVSLALVGSALLLKQGASKAEVLWQQGTEVRVWMQPGASTAELAAIHSQLNQASYVHGCVYRDQLYDYHEAKTLLTPDEFDSLTVGEVPSSFRCTPTQPQDAQLVMNKFTGQPGVRNVTAPIQTIHSMEKVITIIQWTFIVVALVLLISAAVLILNTIRMAIFARRREVSVMKLVGATNWFVRGPFMLEGLLQGLVGSVFAVILLVLGKTVALPSILGHLHSTSDVHALPFAVNALSLIAAGLLLGAAGSGLTLRRFLQV